MMTDPQAAKSHTADLEVAETEATDAELLRRIRNHDEDAFVDLVDRYKDPLVGYLTRLAGCRDRAEEFAQETFVRIYQKLDEYREEGNFQAYLYRIATNLLRSDERRKRRWSFLRPFVRAHEEHVLAEPVEPPAAAVLAREEQREVMRALSQIDLTFREALVLREIEELSYGEIAEVLGVSEGTVKSRLHRGRRLMKQHLTPYWTRGRQVDVATA